MKTKLFTHTDFDGVGNSILAKLAFGEENVDVEYCNYDDIDTKVKDFIVSAAYRNYDKVYITDISVSESVAGIIDGLSKLRDKVLLLDHHPTAEHLNKYEWATVRTHRINSDIKTCGTEMFFGELFSEDTDTALENFVETVCQYDTWRWASIGNIEPKRWNDLLYLISRERFEEFVLGQLKKGKFEISEKYEEMLQIEQEKIDRYVEEKSEQIIPKSIQGYNAGIVFGEQYHSELGNRLAKMHPQYDFIVIVNPATSVSYRSIGDNVHLGKDIASVYGGGGHMNASGSQISDEIREQIINMIFGEVC